MFDTKLKGNTLKNNKIRQGGSHSRPREVPKRPGLYRVNGNDAVAW